jgi:hypothetical protein
MSIATFAYRPETLPPNLNLSGRPQIFEKLQDRDVEPTVSLLAEVAFQGADIHVYDLGTDGAEETVVNGRAIPLDTVGVIINRIGRSIKMDLLPEGMQLPPMINENKTRSLAFRKHRAHDEVLAPLGISIPTVLATTGTGIDAFMAVHHRGSFIVKPDSGTNSEGIQKVARGDVPKLFRDNPNLFGKNVIQPAYDFTHAFPGSLRAYDAASQEAFDGWSNSDVTKEMRVYGFASPAGTTVFPVGRAIHEGDQWFFIDPESVPQHVLESSRQAMVKTAEITSARAVLGTVDWGYGNVGNEAPGFHAIELNAKAPYVIGYDKHAGVADHLRDLLADQIQATAYDV